VTQPLFCSASSPWGIHLSIRDNVCARCGWTAPRFTGAASLSIGIENDGVPGNEREEDGGRA
jgi:hypothetical protein